MQHKCDNPVCVFVCLCVCGCDQLKLQVTLAAVGPAPSCITDAAVCRTEETHTRETLQIHNTQSNLLQHNIGILSTNVPVSPEDELTFVLLSVLIVCQIKQTQYNRLRMEPLVNSLDPDSNLDLHQITQTYKYHL